MRGALIFHLTYLRHHLTMLNANVPNCYISSVKNMKFTMAFGYFCTSCRARVILACLLADVSA